MIWLGLRQLVACVLLSLAGLDPAGAVAADAPRYEIELKLRVDTKNQSLSATTLRLLQMRAHASAWLGSRGLNIVMFPDADDPLNHKMVVRGTTVPRLLERLISARTICGWGRDARLDAGKSKARRTRYDETGPIELARWGAADSGPVYLEVDSDERAVLSASIGRDGADEVLLVSLEEPGPDHHLLIAGGMAVEEGEIQGRPLAALPLPQAPEEEAAILGLVRLAPQTLPQSVLILESQIRPLSPEGAPATVTRRLEAARNGSPESLAALLKDTSPLVRRRAVLAAAERGAKGRPVLERAMMDADPMVAAPAVGALRIAGVKMPEGALLRCAESSAFELAKPALEALMRDGASGQASALRLLRDERRLAAALPEIRLARFRQASALVERLAARGRAPEALRAEARQTLASFGGK